MYNINGTDFCADDTVMFYMSTAYEGSAPVYQWYLNDRAISDLDGGKDREWIRFPLKTGDRIRAVLYNPKDTTEFCPNGGAFTNNPAKSNVLTMNVVPVVTPSVDIAFDPRGNSICEEEVVTMKAVNIKGGGYSPQFEWYINGAFQGTGTTLRYSDYASMANKADTLAVQLKMTSSASCATPSPVFYKDTILIIRPLADMEVTLEPYENICAKIVKEPVAWQRNGNRLDFSDGQIYKYGGCGCWVNGGVVSKQQIQDNGSVSFTPGYVGGHRMVGLSTHTRVSGYGNDYEYAAIDYAIYMDITTLRIYESGQHVASFGRYYADDHFMIEVADSVVRYFRNNELFYTSTRKVNTWPMYAKANMHCIGTWVPNIYVEYRSTAQTFTAHVTNGGTTPRYRWMLNGQLVKDAMVDSTFNVNETSPFTYLRPGDELNCIVTSSYDCISPAHVNREAQAEDPLRFVEKQQYHDEIEITNYTSGEQYITPDTSICYGDTIVLRTGPGSEFKWEFLMADAYDTTYVLDSVYKYDTVASAWSPKFWVPVCAPGTTLVVDGYWDSTAIDFRLDSTFLRVEKAMKLSRKALPIYSDTLKIAPSRAVTYRAWVTDETGCGVNFRRVQVNVYGQIKMDIGPDSVNVCAGDSAMLRIRQSSLVSDFTYSWQTTDGRWTSGLIDKLDSIVYYTPVGADTVVFTIYSGQGCDYIDTVRVYRRENELVWHPDVDTIGICHHGSTVL
ncbi:MAG: hypothetical protein K2I68_02645, partial [Bacteroidales bacterium]|nr:hypothetical protein [Bacteroidales bacterium]